MKKIIIVGSSILVIGIILFMFKNYDNKSFNNSMENNDVIKNDINVKKEILDFKIEDIDENLLNWLEKNYGIETLNNLLEEIKNDNYNLDLWYKLTNNTLNVLKDLANNYYEGKSNVKIIDNVNEVTIDFIGDVSLADNYLVMPEYDKRNKGIYGILSPAVVKELTSSTLTIANNEFTVSNQGEALKNKAFTFRASPNRLKIYAEMGVDLVTLANNHIFDFGITAFLDTLKYLDEEKIFHIGAGRNINEASIPFYLIAGGRKIVFLNANRSEKNILTPGATSDEAGVLRCYDPTYFSNLIEEVKKTSDYVFVLVHWGTEHSHVLEDVQVTTAKLYLDKGADAIIGTHAHTLQGMEFYQNKLIAYNLGNFIFDNKETDTGILKFKILKEGKLEYFFIPAHQSNVYTDLVMDDKGKQILDKMTEYSVNAKFLDDGKIEIK